KILDYVCDPLSKFLQNDNPQVRKTAVIGVAKLYDLKPSLALKTGFVDQLKEMVADSDPMVSTNLSIISHPHIDHSKHYVYVITHSAIANDPSEGVFILDSAVNLKLLVALGEYTKWGGIALLEQICERVVPQFQQANVNVVLAAIKGHPTVQYMSYGQRNTIVDLDIVPQLHIVWWSVYIQHTRLLLDIGSRPVEIIIPSHVFNPARLP
ncbi:hypothetical protein MJO29_006979, partial [Puccinia striiformis f. sp. tritici]